MPYRSKTSNNEDLDVYNLAEDLDNISSSKYETLNQLVVGKIHV